MVETLGECSTTRGLVGTSRHEVGLPEKSREDLGPQWRCTRHECEFPPLRSAGFELTSTRPVALHCDGDSVGAHRRTESIDLVALGTLVS